MAYDANDPKQVKKAQKRAELDLALRLDEIKKVMQTIPGRAWIYDMLDRCHAHHTPFTQGEPDTTNFKLGAQNWGFTLLAEVQQAAPELYLQMINEAKSSSA